MSTAGGALIWCPFPDAESARRAARDLLEDRLVACANILPHIESLFHWHNAVECSSESALLLKTSSELLDQAIARLSQLHPYDTPAIMGWHVDATAPETLGWLSQQLSR